jgi:hypothetical protein
MFAVRVQRLRYFLGKKEKRVHRNARRGLMKE